MPGVQWDSHILHPPTRKTRTILFLRGWALNIVLMISSQLSRIECPLESESKALRQEIPGVKKKKKNKS